MQVGQKSKKSALSKCVVAEKRQNAIAMLQKCDKVAGS
jgi:hypothetical protein